MTESHPPEIVIDDDDDDPEEYNVEDIIRHRYARKTGKLEYLVKWEGYPESDNSWEPSEHCMCPDLIARYEERLKSKKKTRSSITAGEAKIESGRSNRTSKASTSTHKVSTQIVDEDESTCSMETSSSGDKCNAEASPVPQPTGFERGLEIKKIRGSCTEEKGEKEKLCFLVEWKGSSEVDLVDAEDIETKASREMLGWYKERLIDQMKCIAAQK